MYSTKYCTTVQCTYRFERSWTETRLTLFSAVKRNLEKVQHRTDMFDSTVSLTTWILTMWILTPHCQWHRWDRLRDANDTAELDFAVSVTPMRYWHTLKSPRKLNYVQKFFSMRIKWVRVMKKRWSQISWHCPFKLIWRYYNF